MPTTSGWEAALTDRASAGAAHGVCRAYVTPDAYGVIELVRLTVYPAWSVLMEDAKGGRASTGEKNGAGITTHPLKGPTMKEYYRRPDGFMTTATVWGTYGHRICTLAPKWSFALLFCPSCTVSRWDVRTMDSA